MILGALIIVIQPRSAKITRLTAGTLISATLTGMVLVMFVIVPWGAVVYPAILHRFMGDYTAINLIRNTGFHWIGAFTGALICLILIVGAVLE